MASFKDKLKNITAEEFITKISNGLSVVRIGDLDQQKFVKGLINLSPDNYTLDELYLTNLVFEDTVRIGGTKDSLFHIGSGITFRDCTFLRPIVFSCCESNGTNERHFDQKAGAIRIINGSYILLQISNCNFPFGVEIFSEDGHKLEIDWFESQFNHFESAGYNFENVTFKSKLDITADTINNIGVDFRNCISTAPLRISTLNSTSLAFTGKDSNFENDIRIWNGKLGSLTWNDGIFNGQISVELVTIRENLSLIGSLFEDRFTFKRIEEGGQNFNHNLPEEIWIQDSKFQNGFEFLGQKFSSDKLTVVFSEKSSGVIDFRNTFFQEVIFKGINFNNSLFLRDCSYDKLTFSHFFNKALVSLNNNKPEGKGNPEELLIENSNLGNTEFYDFDFSHYPSVRVIDSRLDSIFIYGATWFIDSQLNIDSETTNQTKILSQKREIYRQLKLAAEKQSDRITSLDFKAKEVETHKNLIRSERSESENIFTQSVKPISLLIKKLKESSFYQNISSWFSYKSDLISINLGKTNDHGQNWIKPFLLVFFITLLAFYPLIVISGDSGISWKWDWSAEGWSLFWCKMGQNDSVFWQLFNPTRRVRDMFPNQIIEASTHFWDGLQRIFLAFFIFQIVSAFRKFVK